MFSRQDAMSAGSTFSPLSRDGLVDRVANLIASAIISGRIAPGTRLSESTIARDLGVSRAPVREAARLLESSGLVDYKPNRGFFVHEVSAQALDDLYELRLTIELAAVTRLIQSGAEALPDLRAQLNRLHKAADNDTDLLGHIAADMEFHRLICEASGNPRFLSIFEQIANETKLCLMVIGRLYDDPHEIAETHLPILDAIAAGDAPRAVAALEHHIGTARRMVIDQFRKIQESRPT